MSENLSLRHRIAAELLGFDLGPDGFAPCPGAGLHTTKGGPRDFKVILSGAPTGSCFHGSCAAAVEAFNLELRRRIARAESGGGGSHGPGLGDGVTAPPQVQRKPKRPPFSPEKLAGYAARCPREISLAWLRERSPVAIPPPPAQGREMAAGLFLSALFRPGENVLIFTRQWSQGDFLWRDGETFRLGDAPGVEPVASKLPTGGPEGIWFLCQPVTGEWSANPYASGGSAPPRLGRRHGGNVTSWRYLVLESDEAAPAQWLAALVQLPLALAAIYTSGKRSIHALARVDCASKAEFDALRDDALRVLCPLGADGAAMTAVRLTRLPGMMRHGTRDRDGKLVRMAEPGLQELAWLNPAAPCRPILELVNVR